jgi:hypothetical protein
MVKYFVGLFMYLVFCFESVSNQPGQLILHRFHGACVDITEEVAEMMELKNEKFFCEPCDERVQGKTPLQSTLFLLFCLVSLPSWAVYAGRYGARVPPYLFDKNIYIKKNELCLLPMHATAFPPYLWPVPRWTIVYLSHIYYSSHHSLHSIGHIYKYPLPSSLSRPFVAHTEFAPPPFSLSLLLYLTSTRPFAQHFLSSLLFIILSPFLSSFVLGTHFSLSLALAHTQTHSRTNTHTQTNTCTYLTVRVQ